MAEQLTFHADFWFTRRSPSGLILATGYGRNRIVNTGLDLILDRLEQNPAQLDLYIGLIDNTGFSEIKATDILSSAGWSEFTGYSGNRIAWAPGASSSQERSNAAVRVFTGSTSGTTKGIFLAASATKGETASTLFSAGTFSSNQPLNSGETLSVTYRLQASSGS